MKTITGTFQKPDGSAVASGRLYLQLSQDTTLVGTAQIAPTKLTFILDASGTLGAGVSVLGNDELSPSGTTYLLTVRDVNDVLVYGPETASITGASPINLNSAFTTSSGITYPTAVITAPTAAQTIAGDYALNVGGSVNAKRIENVRYADQFSSVQAAINDLPSGGGKVIIPDGTYTMSGASNISITKSNVTLECTSPNAIITHSGNLTASVPVISIDGSGGAIQNIAVRGCQILGARGTGVRQKLIGIGSSVSNVWIDENYFKNCSADCVLVSGTGNKRLFVERNVFDEFYEQPLDITGGDWDGIYFRHNTGKSSAKNPDGGVSNPTMFDAEPQAGTAAKNTDVSYNDFDFCGLPTGDQSGNGIVISKTGSAPTNFAFITTSFSNNKIHCGGNGVKVDNIRWGSTVTEPASLRVADNEFYALRQDAISVGVAPDISNAFDQLEILDNRVFGWSEATSNTYDGIVVSQFVLAPLIVGNKIMRRFGASGGVSGRYGINLGANTSGALATFNTIYAATGLVTDAGTNNITKPNYDALTPSGVLPFVDISVSGTATSFAGRVGFGGAASGLSSTRIKNYDNIALLGSSYFGCDAATTAGCLQILPNLAGSSTRIQVGTGAAQTDAIVINSTKVVDHPTGITIAGSNTLNAVSGNSGKVAQSSGTLTSGNAAKWDANGNAVDAGGVGSLTIVSGTSTLTANAALAAVTSQAAITTGATGTATTDAIEWSYASAPTAGDSLCHVSPYPTAGNVNFVRTNPTAAAQNVSAIVVNWRVVR